MKKEAYYYDFHIHSCLSPCANDDMTPANIVGMAAVKGLDVIAITDHNSSKNCEVAMKWGEKYNVLVIPGMELTTLEEVHVIILFYDIYSAMAFDNEVEKCLIKVKNVPIFFGNQYIIGEDDAVEGIEENLLIQATTIPFIKVYELAKRKHGIMVPAHIDKNTNSLISNLGFIPSDSKFSVAEIARGELIPGLIKNHPYLKDCMLLHNSDAHSLAQIKEPADVVMAKEKSISAILNEMSRWKEEM